MIEEQEKNRIISNAINAAICIDDEYASPYSSSECDKERGLYQSFRKQGKCAIDIYKYTDFETFKDDKDYLLNHKELMILDWELNGEAPGKAKYEEALKVLEYAIIDKHIRCVTIYTQSNNFAFILLQIYSYFSRVYSIDNLNKNLVQFLEYIADALEVNSDVDDGLQELTSLLNVKSSGFCLSNSKNKNERLKELKMSVLKKVEPKNKGSICSLFKDGLKSILSCDDITALSYYEITNEKGIDDYKYKSESAYPVEVYNEKYLLINNTIVFVLNKALTGVTDVYTEITKAISEIPNQRTLLLSLIMKNVLYENSGKGGKGLGKVTDRMLMHHWQSYEHQNIDDLVEFLILCMKEDIAEYFRDDKYNRLIEELFQQDDCGSKVLADEEELALFNQIITFIEKKELSNKTHKIKTGDIFKLTSRLYEIKDSEKQKGVLETETNKFNEYLICISQSCDCLRADKIHNNFAFAYGDTYQVKMSKALQNIEKEDKYSIIDKDTAIKWHNNFFTIHIEENEFNINDEITVQIENKEMKLEYVGVLKDFYAQRIINKVYNNALRIGVDLPHL